MTAPCIQEPRLKTIEDRLKSFAEPKFIVTLVVILISGLSLWYTQKADVAANTEFRVESKGIPVTLANIQKDIEFITAAVKRMERTRRRDAEEEP